MGTKTILPPSLWDAVSTADLRAHLRLSPDGEQDQLAAAYLAAAHATAEHFTGRPIGTQTRELALSEFPDGPIELGQAVTAVQSVTYTDTAGATVTMNASGYYLEDHGFVHLLCPAPGATWPAVRSGDTQAVRVLYRCGDVPACVRSALLLMVGWLYDNRGGTSGDNSEGIQPPAALALLWPVKQWGC